MDAGESKLKRRLPVSPLSEIKEEAKAPMSSEAPMSARSFSQLLDELQQTRDSIAQSMKGALEYATAEGSNGKEEGFLGAPSIAGLCKSISRFSVSILRTFLRTFMLQFA